MANINDENKELMASYPNVRRIMISTQTFTLEEVHQAIQDWIKSLRQSGDIASLARIKYATMNPDTSQPVLLKLVRLAIGSCANERIRNEAMTNVVWPISFTQDLLGLLTAIDYDISAVDAAVETPQEAEDWVNSSAISLFDYLKLEVDTSRLVATIEQADTYFEADNLAKEWLRGLVVELSVAINSSNNSDNYEF